MITYLNNFTSFTKIFCKGSTWKNWKMSSPGNVTCLGSLSEPCTISTDYSSNLAHVPCPFNPMNQSNAFSSRQLLSYFKLTQHSKQQNTWSQNTENLFIAKQSHCRWYIQWMIISTVQQLRQWAPARLTWGLLSWPRAHHPFNHTPSILKSCQPDPESYTYCNRYKQHIYELG